MLKEKYSDFIKVNYNGVNPATIHLALNWMVANKT